jgi:hypothetical protein
MKLFVRVWKTLSEAQQSKIKNGVKNAYSLEHLQNELKSKLNEVGKTEEDFSVESDRKEEEKLKQLRETRNTLSKQIDELHELDNLRNGLKEKLISLNEDIRMALLSRRSDKLPIKMMIDTVEEIKESSSLWDEDVGPSLIKAVTN